MMSSAATATTLLPTEEGEAQDEPCFWVSSILNAGRTHEKPSDMFRPRVKNLPGVGAFTEEMAELFSRKHPMQGVNCARTEDCPDSTSVKRLRVHYAAPGSLDVFIKEGYWEDLGTDGDVHCEWYCPACMVRCFFCFPCFFYLVFSHICEINILLLCLLECRERRRYCFLESTGE